MVAIVSGGALGIELTSLRTLGSQGSVGNASHGRSNEAVYVNATNGNVVVQDRDDVLALRGPDSDVLRTYNSLGTFTDDNGDNWSDGVAPWALEWTGTPNSATATVRRRDRDGSVGVYTWDAAKARYFTADGDGAYDTITFIAADNQFEWKDGTTGATQRYAATGSMKLVSSKDALGNAMTFEYDGAGRLVKSAASNGDVTWYDRTAGNLVQVRTVTAQGETSVLVRYAYDGANRLTSVTVDLGAGAAYTTSYAYNATGQLASLLQSDGTQLLFGYEGVAGAYRIRSVTDAGTQTLFAYDATGRMTSSTTAGLTTQFTLDAAGNFTGITPPGSGGQPALSVTWDSAGNVASVTEGTRTTTYEYANGNRTKERAAGVAIDRRFDSANHLISETRFTSPDPDGLGPASPGGPLTTRHVYSGSLLRFSISAQGRVVEYRYEDAFQNNTSILSYANLFSVASLLPGDALSYGSVLSWAVGQWGAIAERVDATFDGRGQVQTRTTFARTDSNGWGLADGSQSVERFVYDQRGRLLQRIAPSGPATIYTYDGLGRELTRRDAAGQLTTTLYQDTQRKTTVTSSNGLVTTSTFDSAGRLVGTVQSSAAAANLGQTSYVYDTAGRLRMSTDPTGVKHWWIWDDAGRCIGEIDGNGTLTESAFDKAGLLVSRITYATAVATSSLVDTAGNAIAGATLASIRPATTTTSDVAEWRMHDAAGRLVRVARSTGTGALAAVTEYTYDAASRLVAQAAYATPIATGGITSASIPSPVVSGQDRITRYFHDAEGRLLGTLDPEGYLARQWYDGAGRLVERIAYATAANASFLVSGTLSQLMPAANAADQRTVTFHNGKGQVAAIIDAEGYLTEMAYDLDGNRVRATRYATRVTVAFTSSTALSAIRPAAAGADQVTTSVFDSLGRLQQETGPDGVTTAWSYDSVGNIVATARAVSTTDERGIQARFDLQGRKTAELTGEGVALLTAGLSQSGIDAIWAQYGVMHAYDTAGRRISTADATGRKTLYYYDADGAIVFTVNALGEVTESRYDVIGRETSRIARATRVATAGLTGGLATDALQALLSPVSANDSVETITYTRDGRVSSRSDAEGGVTTFTTNAFGEVIGTSQLVSGATWSSRTISIDRRGKQVSTLHDPGGLNLLTSAVYDAFGRAVRTTDALGKTSTRTYDRLGRMVVVTDPLNATRSTTYDAFDRVLTQTDAMGAVTTYAYDTAGRSVRVTTAENVSTVTVSNRHGQVQSITDAKGQTTSYAYDRNGRLLQTTTPLTTTGNTYDVAGRQMSSVDANGKTVTYTYDSADRVLTRTVDPGGLALVTSWQYDAKGQAVSLTDANGIVTTFAYDRTGQVLRQTVNPTGLNLSTVFTYDERGKTLTVTSPQGTVTQHVYDVAGRRISEIVDRWGLSITRNWTYDGEGRVVTAIDGAGNATRYAYDAAGQLLFTVDPAGGVQQLVYDPAGRVTKTVAYTTPISLVSLPAAPSAADIQARVAAQAQDQVEHRVYDRDGRLAATVDGTGAVVRYAYDGKGNLVNRTAFARTIALSGWQAGSMPSPQADSAHDQKTTFVHDALDRVLYSIDGTGAVVEQAYDGNGNVVRRTAYARAISAPATLTQGAVSAAVALVADAARDSTVRNTYDAANRLTWTVDGTGAVVQHQYDRNGNVVGTIGYASAIAPSAAPSTVAASTALDRATTHFYDAANRVVFEVDASNAVREMTYDKDGHVLKRIAYANAATSVPSPTSANAVATLRTKFTTSAADRVTQFAWDGAGRLMARLDAEGGLSQTQYDGAGRVTATIDFETRLTVPSYYPFPQALATVVSSPGDRKIMRAYDAAGRVMYQVGAMGEITGFQYDGVGRLLRQTKYATLLPAGSGPLFYAYGLPSNSGMTAAQVSAALFTNSATDRVETSTFDAAGNVLSTTDANGSVETFTYDALGGKLTFTNRKGAVWRYDRDAAGRVVQETSPQVELTSAVVDASGNVVSSAAVSASVVTRFAYDALGNLSERTEAAGRTEQRTTRYEYDQAGRQVRVVHPSVGTYNAAADDLSANGAIGVAARTEQVSTPETRTFYDALGNAVAGRDVGNRVSQKVYDRAGRVEYEIDALGQVTRYVRNAFGEVTALTRYANPTNLGGIPIASAAGSATRSQVQAAVVPSGSDRTVTTAYDRNGRIVTVEEPGVLTYDAGASNPSLASAVTKPTTTTTYNAFGEAIRVAHLRNAAGGTKAITTHYFDKSGQEIATVDAMGYLTQRDFDARGNVTEVRERAVAITAGNWTPTSYVAPAAASDDRTTRFTYDKLDRKTAERRVQMDFSTAANGTTVRGDVVTTYGYDALGNLTRTTDATGGATYTAYDALGRVLAVAAPARTSTASGAAITPVTSFRRDAFGNVVVQTESAAGAVSAGESGIVAVAGSGDHVTRTAYDSFGQAIATVDAQGSSSFTSYDAWGHVAKTWRGVNGHDGQVRTAYQVNAYDGVGQLTSVIEPAAVSASIHAVPLARLMSDTAGGNKLALAWSGLVLPGGGQVSVQVNYRHYATDEYGNTTVSASSVSTGVSASSASGGLEVAWFASLASVDAIYVQQVSGAGQWVTLWQGSLADAKGGTMALQQAGTVGTALEYNAFGELTRKGVQGGRQEYFDYDNAGRLWRTNAGDGIDRIRLFDAQGHVTAEMTSAGIAGNNTDLQSFADAQAAANTAGLRRTDTAYDLLGRVTSQTLAARSESTSAAMVQRTLVSATIAESAAAVLDENGFVQSWSGTNRLVVSWSSLAALGSGDVQVRIDYVTANVQPRAGIPRSWSSGVLEASAGATGISTAWVDPHSDDGGIARVTRVLVQKKDVQGNWVVVIDQGPGYGSNSVDITSPADPGVRVKLEVRTTGSPGDTGWWEAPAPVAFGNVHRFTADSLGVGGYDYRLKLIAASGEERIATNGTLNVAKPPLAAIATPIAFGSTGPGVLSWATPGEGTGQTFRYRLAGSTGAWSTSTVLPRAGGAKDGVDTAGFAAGRYDYELLWTPAGTGIPASHATGQFTVVAGVPSQWVPPVNLPPIGNLRILGSPGSSQLLMWDLSYYDATATAARIRPAGGSWTSLAIGTDWSGQDEYGMPAGNQHASLGTRPPGTYELQVTWGSPPTHQATATLTVHGASGGYYVTDWFASVVDRPVIAGYDYYGNPIYATDEYGIVLIESVLVWTPVQRWVAGTVPPPTFTVTTPPYTPGYWTAAIAAQYQLWTNASPGSLEISGSEGGMVAQAITSAEGPRDTRPQVLQKTDRWGNVVEITDPRSPAWKTTYKFNAFDLVVKETRPTGSVGTPITETYYDALGRQVAVRDANNNVTGESFDAGGNLVQEMHADGGVVRHRYDAFGNRVQTIDAENKLVSFSYDSLGRLLSRQQGAVQVYHVLSTNWLDTAVQRQVTDSWTYDQLGRKLTQTNGEGEVLRYRYDLRGNLVETIQPLGQAVRATYDAQGRKTAEIDANGLLATWSYDYFGRLTGHTDIGGAAYSYAYDNAKQLFMQTNTRGQALRFGFDTAGQQNWVYDAVSGKTTTSAYDLAGRKVRETVVQDGLTYQDNHLSYDALGNLRDVADARVHLLMEYDKAGNRTRVKTTVNYQGIGGETTSSTDRYFKYDAMNRQTTVDAVDSAGNLGLQGHQLAYDKNGNRTRDRWQVTGAGGGLVSVTEDYAYDAMNRLLSTVRDGSTVDSRWYDGASRVVQSQAPGAETRINRYDANGRLLHQKILTAGLQQKTDVTWDPSETTGWTFKADGYDAAGNTLGWAVRNDSSGPALASYRVDLQRFEGYVGRVTDGAATAATPTMTTQHYDVNGALVGVTDPSRTDGNRSFVNDAAGRVLSVNQGGRVQRQLIVDGEVLGAYGVGVDPANPTTGSGNPNFGNIVDFDFGYSKISAAYPAATPGAYMVRPGDTLQRIAQSAYGDSKLWYRIADANGLASSASLKVGQTLNIPSGVGTISNNGSTFKPYDASRVVGDTTPSMLPAPGGDDGGCGGMGKVLMVVVAVVVTVVSGGAAAGAINGFWSGIFNSALGCTVGATTAAAVATAATAAALGSVAAQAVGMATGNVQSFDWRSVALSAVSGGVTQGLAGGGGSLTAPVVRAALANAMSQGIGVVTGLQRRFDWKGVAGSSTGTAVGQSVGSALNLPSDGSHDLMQRAEYLATATFRGLAAGVATAFARGGKVAVQQVAADSFGAAIGNLFVEAHFLGSLPEDATLRGATWATDVHSRKSAINQFGLTTQATNGELTELGAAMATAIDGFRYAFEAEEPGMVKAGQAAAHLTLPALIGKLAGVPEERVQRLAAYSQLLDQLDTHDAAQNGARYYKSKIPFIFSRETGEAGKTIEMEGHALNGYDLLINSTFAIQLATKHAKDDSVVGWAMHFGADGVFHIVRGGKTERAPNGHAIHGNDPDYPTMEKMRAAAGVTMAIYQAIGYPIDAGNRRVIFAKVDAITRDAISMARTDLAAWLDSNPPVDGVHQSVPYTEGQLTEHYWRHLGGAAAGTFVPNVRLSPLPNLVFRGAMTPQGTQAQGMGYLYPAFGADALGMIRNAQQAITAVDREYKKFFEQLESLPNRPGSPGTIHEAKLYDPPLALKAPQLPSPLQLIREVVNRFVPQRERYSRQAN